MQTFKGNTLKADSPFLDAEFWKKGVQIEGTVLRAFQTQNGQCYEVSLNKPVSINGKNATRISVGAMAGFQMAIHEAGLEELERDDKIILKCLGETATTKGNARKDFDLAVARA